LKILLFSEVFPPAHGGSGRWLWELHRRLTGFDIVLAVGAHRDAAAFDTSSGFPTDRLNLRFADWGVFNPKSALHYLRVVLSLRSIVSRSRPAVIHCGKCLPEGLVATALKKLMGVPFRCFVHGEELTLAGTSRELRRLTAIVLKQADQLIANSHHTKNLLVDRWGVPEPRVIVIHPGVETDHFKPALRSETVRARLGWQGHRVILTVGALQKRKGQDMMIRALPMIRQVCPDVLYAIVGEGWERPYLESLVDQYGVRDAVQFRPIPADRELIDCYQQCDLFALPNRQVGWDFEGFGIVLLEAQACGAPVVAGLSGGTAETMRPAITGALVNCDAPEALAETIVSLLQDPERRAVMGRAGREWVGTHFDWRSLVAQARQVFDAPAVADVST
jgi:phosphatidylinositol alpha-1,6-mannosyltransferase